MSSGDDKIRVRISSSFEFDSTREELQWFKDNEPDAVEQLSVALQWHGDIDEDPGVNNSKVTFSIEEVTNA